MNDNEQQTEDRIETVLAALRQAEPAPGMEQRITAALLRKQTAAATRPSCWTWLHAPQLAGVAAVLMAGLLLSVHSVRRQPAMPVQARFAPPTVLAVPLEQVQPSLQHARVSQTTNTATEVSRPPARGRAQTVHPAAGGGSLLAKQTQTEQGFPAPPLPLTEQERLLVRLIHRYDPLQLAQLTPAAREADLQRDRQQVREFFKPPPMLAANFTLEPYPTSGGTQ